MKRSVLFIYSSLADYHADRLMAADQVLKDGNIELHLIEIFTNQTFYNHKQNRIAKAREQFLSRWHPCSDSTEGCPFKPQGIFALIHTIRKIKPQIVFVYGYQYLGAWLTLLLARFMHMKVILLTDSKADDGIRNRYKEWFKRQIVRHFDGAFVAGNRHIEYVESLGIKPGASYTGLDVIDNDSFGDKVCVARSLDCQVKTNGELVFLVVARLVERKGVEYLLRAFSIALREVDVPMRLWVAGDGELRQHLETVASSLGFSKAVNFFGACSNEDVAYYMAHCDCLVLPSEYDQWGLVVNEAMVAGLPVIVTNTCGCAGELVRAGVEGIIVLPKNVGQLAAALKEAALRPDLRAAWGTNSRKRVKLFSLNTWANTIKQIAS